MSDAPEIAIRTPLAHMAKPLAAGSSGGQGAELAEIQLSALVNLRGKAADAGFAEAVRGALGIEPPVAPNTFARIAGRRCLWLGPDEWLVACDQGEKEHTAVLLRDRLAGQHTSVIDLGAAYAVLELRGAKARAVLAKACSLDFHPRAFRAGQCAQSNFARTQAIVMLEDDAPVFRLFVRRSFASYLAEWLLDAMREYRVA
ncbi:MAG TPA: sarcosine oxidase subunit gamma family protein [Burkholderiales bacterium]|nr:sarcosine oxidase subunit gamma family protein [Burkholderiales bacterium]